MNEPKNSLIIGNGFDIDLGLNTRFSDFANAKDFWPENDGSKLSAYLESKKSVEKWFNLEGHYGNMRCLSRGNLAWGQELIQKEMLPTLLILKKCV